MNQQASLKSKSINLLSNNSQSLNKKINIHIHNIQESIINTNNNNKNRNNYKSEKTHLLMDSSYSLKLPSKFKRSLKKLKQKISTIDKWKQKYISLPQQLIYYSPIQKLQPIQTNRHINKQRLCSYQQKNIFKDLVIMRVRISKTINIRKNKKNSLLNLNQNIKNQFPLKQYKQKSHAKSKQKYFQIIKSKNSEKIYTQRKNHKKYNMMLSKILQGKPQRWQFKYQEFNQIQNEQQTINLIKNN